jgi:hypothetical protein
MKKNLVGANLLVTVFFVLCWPGALALAQSDWPYAGGNEQLFTPDALTDLFDRLERGDDLL